MRKGILIGGMVLGLLMGCNNGIAELENRNTFFDSVIKISQGFQEMFGVFGNTMGEALGFNAVKSGDTRDKVGEHFKKVKQGLEETKNELKELSGKMSQAKNADTKGVEGVISSASEVIGKLIESVTKLAGVTKEETLIGDANSSGGAVAPNRTSVEAIITVVKEIVNIAENSGVKVKQGDAGVEVANTKGPRALVHNIRALAGDSTNLADEEEER